MAEYIFKESKIPGYFIYIGKTGNKTEFRKEDRPDLFEMKIKWEKSNTIEPAETEEEFATRLAEESTKALATQYQTCKNLLDNTQYIVNGDCDYPQADIDTCRLWRTQIKTIMRGTEIVEIPERTF